MIDMYPPAEYYQLAQAEAQPEAHEVKKVDVKSVGEIRIDGPFVYVELLDGATEYRIQYLNWREP